MARKADREDGPHPNWGHIPAWLLALRDML